MYLLEQYDQFFGFQFYDSFCKNVSLNLLFQLIKYILTVRYKLTTFIEIERIDSSLL